MIVITGTFDLKPEQRGEAFSLLAEMAKASLAEDGCSAYAFFEDITRPNHFRVYEEWADEDAVAFHFATPHMAVFLEGLGQIRPGNMDIQKIVVSSTGPLTNT